ncbi:hypothetical protein MLD38_013775 [Melastoma candidum]|uniref:Uncharacterized protein n=1 Tax=Melastoma candidum TaxID=119954 RepID=A0ACB9RBT1_9MYRT|nr:hypothetical protein MLD38_013775 [Melastoma candidum]
MKDHGCGHGHHLLRLLTSFLSLSNLFPAGALDAYPGMDIPDCASPGLVPIRREVYGEGRIFDITHRITSDLPSYESMGSLGKFLWLPISIKNGSLTNNSEMKLPAHTGTHVDAPGHVFDHYFDAGFDIDTLDLEVLNVCSIKQMASPPLDTPPKFTMALSPLHLLLLASLSTALKSVPASYAGHCSLSSDDGPRRAYGFGKIIDITHRISSELPAFIPGGKLGEFLWLMMSMKNGSIANFSELKLMVHTGTHVDAPGHVFDGYYDDGFDVDSLDLEVLNGN